MLSAILLMVPTIVAALVTEIKEVKETKQKEDEFLLTLAAGSRPFIGPHLEYEYSDVSIHEDLYKLVQYSCKEIYSPEQLNKVMKLYTTFLEPMLGIPSHIYCSKVAEEVKELRNRSTNCGESSTGESDGNSGGDATVINSEQPKSLCSDDGNTLTEALTVRGTSLATGDATTKEDSSRGMGCVSRDEPISETVQLGKDQKNADAADKICGLNKHVTSIDRDSNMNASLANGAENSHDRTGVEVVSGFFFLLFLIFILGTFYQFCI